MTRCPGAAASVVALTLLAGCVTEERLGHSFRDSLDSCVGQRFMDPATWFCHWADAIGQRQVDANTEEYEMAVESLGRCRWVYVVDRESRKVTAWRFTGGEEDCYARIDWLGPW